ncbi:MAG: CARDB domain-containing protein [Planctomycetota bacterium]
MKRIMSCICLALLGAGLTVVAGCGGGGGGGGGGSHNPPAQPNLTVDTVSFGVVTIEVATPIAINRTLHNSGTAAALAFDVAYYFSIDATLDTVTDTLVGTENVAAGLALGTDAAGQFTVTSPVTVATYYCFAVIDSAGVIVESNEADNNSAVSSNALAVVAAGSLFPDLEGTIVSAPAVAYAGQTI